MKKAVADKKRSTGTAFDPEVAKSMFAHKDEHPRHDVKDTGYSKRYTRKAEPESEKDDAEVSDAPKKKGRPKGPAKGPERTTKGAWKHKGERKVKEDGIPVFDRGEYDDEAGMTKDSLHTIVRHAKELERALRSNENLPEWVQEKIGQIKGMMSSVTDYIVSTHERDAEQHTGREGITIEPVAENANVTNIRLNLTEPQAAILLTTLIASPESKYYKEYIRPITAQLIGQGVTSGYDKRTLKQFGPSQQGVAEIAPPGAKAERMVKHIKKSLSKDGHLSDKDKAIAYATTWKAKKAGKVEEESTDKEDQRAEKAGKKVAKDIEYDEGHKGRDDNRAEKAGKKVTKDIEYDDKKDRKEKKVDETTTSGSVATATTSGKSSKGGMSFGKGVYESFNASVEQMITESISVQENVEECGMEGGQPSITITADGEEAAKLMMLLKLAGLDTPQAELDENEMDWPTDDQVTGANDPQLRRLSGGLDGPKSTGQTTTVGGGIPNYQVRRQVSMEESVELERSLFKTWKDYKG
jgi:hypothetical protein